MRRIILTLALIGAAACSASLSSAATTREEAAQLIKRYYQRHPEARRPISAQPQSTQEPASPAAPPPAVANQPFGVTPECKELFARGLEFTKAGNQKGAIRLYGEVLAQCPRTCPAMNNLGSAYDAIGDRDNAKIWFEAAVRCDPENQIFRTNAAASLTKPDTDKQCENIVSQGITKSRNRDLQGAIELYQRALQLCPQHCPAMNDIGVTYEALGDKKAAKTWVDAAVRCNPGSDLYKQNTARIAIALQQLPASPPSVASSSGFDGVYVGSSMSGGRKTAALTFTVVGTRIFLSGNNGQQFGGTVGPHGDFVIVAGKSTYSGKIAGKSLSGNWRLPRGWLSPASPEMTGPFSASQRS